MRQVVLLVVCLGGLWNAANAQTVREAPESGIASWYGAPYHGRPSASGEVYDQEKLTAAHRTLPFGTRVRVRRLDRNRSVVVRINDRGPFVKSRIIDVSHAAAVQLGMTDGAGLAPVTLEVMETPKASRGNIASTDLFLSHNSDEERVSVSSRAVETPLRVDTPAGAK